MHKIGFYIPLLILLANCWQILAEDVVSYKNFRVYRVTKKGYQPFNLESPAKSSRLLMLSEGHEYDENNHLRSVSSFLVPWDEEKIFLSSLNSAGLVYEILVKDLEEKIQEEKKSTENQRRGFSISDITRNYYSYEEMLNFLQLISTVKNPYNDEPVAVVEPIGKSYQGRKMYLVKISSDHSAKKPVIFIEAGIHAREWTAPSAALYIISQLVSNFTYTSDLLNNIDYFVIPLSNPDGYEYSRAIDRLWRKTRSVYRGYYGVDGNRNFDFHWGEGGSSSDPSSEIFQGPWPFSEPETRNIRDAGRQYIDRLAAFISIHNYGPIIVYPWSYKRNTPAPDVDVLAEVAQKAVDAIKKFNGTTYRHGVSSVLMYEASGGSDDYFKGALGVDLSFTMELSSAKRKSFIVPAGEIHEIVTEAFEGIKSFAESAVEHRYKKYNISPQF